MKASITIIVYDAGFKGGKTKAMIELANVLAPNFEVTLLSLRKPLRVHFKLSPGVNLQFVSNFADKKTEKAYNIYMHEITVSMEKKISQVLQNISTDFLYLPNYDSALYYQIKFHVRKQTKIIIGDHAGQRYSDLKNISKNYFHKNLTDRYIGYALSAFDAVHLVNPLVEKYYQQIAKKTFVIPNIVTFPPKKSFIRKKHIIMVGRLDHVKNQRFGIDAFSRIAADYKGWELHIYGDGPYYQDLEKQIQDHSLERKVILHGHKKYMSKIYKKASIFLTTSSSESFGLTYIEAMRYSLPIISFESPLGAQYLLAEQRGRLVEQNNVDQLAVAISQTIDAVERKDNALRMQLKENLQFSEQFFPEYIGMLWQKQLTAMLSHQ